MACEPLFLDTSILVSLRLKLPKLSVFIRDEVCQPSRAFTGASVYSILEFEQCVLKEAADYLIDLLESKAYFEVREHVTNVLTSFHHRKEKICQLLFTIIDVKYDKITIYAGDGTLDRTKWAIQFLKQFRRTELTLLRRSVNHWNDLLKCKSAKFVESRRSNDAKPKSIKCTSSDCMFLDFLERHRADAPEIIKEIEALSKEKITSELQRIHEFLKRWLAAPAGEYSRKDGCRLIADLIIALESDTFPTIYTQNSKEFLPLCRALGKNAWIQSNKPVLPQKFPAQ